LNESASPQIHLVERLKRLIVEKRRSRPQITQIDADKKGILPTEHTERPEHAELKTKLPGY
jgi:hypothetical protein